MTHRKVFLDGTLGSHTAALLAPYHDRPGEHGALRVDRAWLLERVRAADAAGWAIAFHAVGDAAVACALEVIESLPARARKLPHRIEHAQVVEPSDADRMRRAGVAVSMQPAHFTADRGWIESRLGRARSQRAYPWRTLLEAGVSVAFGSDWPVASLDPLEGVRAAVLRGDPEGLSLGQAMRAYTEGSANAAGVGAQVGCLHRGLRADFVGLNHDPRELEPEGSLTDLRVVGSWIGGRRV